MYASGILRDFDGDVDLDDQAEASQIFFDAMTWIDVENEFKPEDSSQDWKIKSIGALDPELKREWNHQRLWMMDPMDGILGDDAMPAACMACHGKFWGEDMVSIRLTIYRLRKRYGQPTHSIVLNVWNEVEKAVVRKLRANRICKKCFNHEQKVRANPWQIPTYEKPASPLQLPLPFSNIPSHFPNMSQTHTSGMQASSYSTTTTYSGMTINDV